MHYFDIFNRCSKRFLRFRIVKVWPESSANGCVLRPSPSEPTRCCRAKLRPPITDIRGGGQYNVQLTLELPLCISRAFRLAIVQQQLPYRSIPGRQVTINSMPVIVADSRMSDQSKRKLRYGAEPLRRTGLCPG
jgi:hypothetical protein